MEGVGNEVGKSAGWRSRHRSIRARGGASRWKIKENSGRANKRAGNLAKIKHTLDDLSVVPHDLRRWTRTKDPSYDPIELLRLIGHTSFCEVRRV
jgi:hypothetical protein